MSIKDRFIENVLRDEGNRLLRNQGKALRKRLKFHTHRLYDTPQDFRLGEPADFYPHRLRAFPRYETTARRDDTAAQATYPQPVCLRTLPVDRRAVAV